MALESDPVIASEANNTVASEGRNAVEIVTSLWEKMESLVQLELKLALAEADDKVSRLKGELFAEAEDRVSVLKREVFAEAEDKVSVLKREVFAEAEDKVSALKRELFAKAIAGSIAFASMVALASALVALLALKMDVWIAALIVSSVLAVASVVMLRRSATLTPLSADEPRTRASLTPTTTPKETRHGTI